MTANQRELFIRDESIRKVFLVKQDSEVQELILNTLVDPRFNKEKTGKNQMKIGTSSVNF